jgi:hypothetical protein
MSTVDLLIKEVGGLETKTLSFDQFWQLVNLLEDASDAAADRVSDLGDDSELDASPEELEQMARSIFDDLKNPKTNTVTTKKLKNWEGIKQVLDNGELSKGALNSAIKQVGADKTNELNFDQFSELMELLEDAMDEEDEPETVALPNASGRGFASRGIPVAVEEVAKKGKAVDSKVIDIQAEVQPIEAKPVAKKAETESEEITREIYEELRGNVSKF